MPTRKIKQISDWFHTFVSQSKNPLRAKITVTFLALFIIFNVCIGFFVIANLLDLHILETEHQISLPLSYPAQTDPVLHLDFETVYVVVTIEYSDLLIEREPVTISAIGTLSPKTAENISSVSVGFNGALEYSNNPVPIAPIFSGVQLNTTDNVPYTVLSLGAGLVGEKSIIYWSTQGDYSPSMIIWYKDSSYSIHSFENYKLHVAPYDVLIQKRNSQINTALSIALFAFAVVGSIDAMNKIWKWRKSTNETLQTKAV